mgnify:CR=1 FL=1
MARYRNTSSGVVVDVTTRPTWDRWEKLDGTHSATDQGEESPTTDQGEESPTTDQGEISVPEGVPDGVPSKTASRAEWASYAAANGIEPGTMTRAELQAAVAGL